MNPNTATEYRNLPLAALTESTTNPRHIFEDAALKELAESIRTQGILHPCLSGQSRSKTSRLLQEPDATAPRRWPRLQLSLSASSTSPMPKQWRPLWSKTL